MLTTYADLMWTIAEETFQPEKLHHKETLFTIGNGYLSTRGVFEEGYPDECRTTFLHGVFDDVPVFYTELANAPDWLPLQVLVDGERFSLDSGSLQGYSRFLDLKTGLLTRHVRWVSPKGKQVELTFERFTSYDDEHLLALRCTATTNFEGKLEFQLGLNGDVENIRLPHWGWIKQGFTDEGVTFLQSRTLHTDIHLALAMVVKASRNPDQETVETARNKPARSMIFNVKVGDEIRVEKLVGVATSRDTWDTLAMATEHACSVSSWEQAFELNKIAWQQAWERMDITIEGDDAAQVAVRASLFQLYIAAPRHDDRVNIGAKTLSGYGYRGHSFWDTEVFMLPVFIHTAPEIARNLLNYRYQRLEAARKKAAQNGFKGAQFPWESANTGEEVTPRWVPDFTDHNNMVRIWTGDIEIHISADVSYAAWLYWISTGDNAWFIDKGAELILDTARFWASRAEWDAQEQRYEYNDVIGPDEYHDHVDNNFYTNYMARWNLITALEVVEWLQAHAREKYDELVTRLELNQEELSSWEEVAGLMYLPMGENGLIEQFEGYFALKDIDLDALEPRTISAQVLFGIEGVSKTQIIKQPDVLMLLYIMRDDFEDAQVRVNYDYYTPRTDLTFGSSLGPSIQSAITCRMRDCENAYENFIRASDADLKDVRGNAGDGIHGASAGGIWQSVVFGFAGLSVTPEKWEIEPCLPSHWKRLRFHFTFRGELQTVDIFNQ